MVEKALVVISLDVISDNKIVISLNEVATIPDLLNVLGNDPSNFVV